MLVGVVQFELFMPYNHSLKEKRQILNKLKERVYQNLKITLTEVDHQDLWQRASLGMAVVGNDASLLDSTITRTMNFVVSMNLGEVSAENRDIFEYE
jgi:uncharacterized protein YlxP (DUF503 family)